MNNTHDWNGSDWIGLAHAVRQVTGETDEWTYSQRLWLQQQTVLAIDALHHLYLDAVTSSDRERLTDAATMLCVLSSMLPKPEQGVRA